jgi:cytochrome c553
MIVSSAFPAWAGEAASVRNCTWCHGTSAQGFSTAPRLAGQRRQYLETELVSFHQHTRDNPFSKQFMWGAVAALNPRVAHDLSIYFSTLPAKAARDGERELAAKGKAIYELGVPEANVVSCLVCHAPNGEGVRGFPRLAGLSYFYLKRRLAEWGQGYHSSAQSPMPQVASTLSPDQIDALASYLSFVQ